MNYQTGYTSYLTKKLQTGGVELEVAIPPTRTSGRMLLKKGNTKEWIKYTGVTGNKLTGVVRQLSTTADPITSLGSGNEWPAGTQITLVVMHDQQIDKTEEGDFQFQIDEINDDLVLKANNCTITPISANYTFTGDEINNTGFSINTTSGDITIDLDLSLFDTADGLYEFIFCKSTADSNSVIIDVGAGKTIDGAQTYELTTQWETVTIKIASATFAKVVSTSNKPLIIPTPTVQSFVKSLVAGEAMSAGQVYRRGILAPIIENFIATNGDAFCYSNAAYERGQGITGNGVITQIITKLYKVGTGGNTVLNLEIYSDAGFTNLLGTSTNSLTSSTLTSSTSGQEVSWNFSNINVSNFYYKYNIVSGSVSTSNYVVVIENTTSVYSGGNAYLISNIGGVTSEPNVDHYFKIILTDENINKFYLAKADSTSKLKTEGIVTNSVIADANFNGAFEGIAGGFSGLLTGHSIGDLVYLQDNGNIGFTAGTNPISIGRIFSATEIEFIKNVKINDRVVGTYGETDIGVTTYTMKYSNKVIKEGYYLIGFYLRASSSSHSVFGRIYKNGIAYGTERFHNLTTNQYYEELLYFGAGDTIDFFVKNNNLGYTAYQGGYNIDMKVVDLNIVPLTIL